MSNRPELQQRITAYFEVTASSWDDLYSEEGLRAEIFRRRQETVLAWIDALDLPPAPRVLDVGSGAGHLTVQLANRGFDVSAIDPSASMRERTRARVEASGFGGQVTVSDADVQALPYNDGEFDLAVALGVLPWIPHPSVGVAEMSRVLKQGGFLIVTADNAWRLTFWLDPRLWPAHAPLRRFLKRVIKTLRSRNGVPVDLEAAPTHHTIMYVDRLLGSTVTKVRAATVGFGPVTLNGRSLTSNRRGVAIHRRLQRLADRGIPILRSAGTHYIVLARKVEQEPASSTTVQ